jgi:hypothetical protein
MCPTKIRHLKPGSGRDMLKPVSKHDAKIAAKTERSQSNPLSSSFHALS